MSKLQDFLNENYEKGLTQEVIISQRIKDEKGEYLKFKIKALSIDEIDEARMKSRLKGNNIMSYNKIIALQGTIDPEFKNAEEMEKVKCLTPEEYIEKVLRAGEIDRLSMEILKLSGYNFDMDKAVKEVKN